MKPRLFLAALLALGCDHAAPVRAPNANAGQVAAPRVEGEGEDEGAASAAPAGESTANAQTATSATTAPTAAGAADRLIAEATRELRAMKTTRYRHKTHVDEPNGVFEYDCSGFVAYALRSAAPDALAVVPVGAKGRPKAEHFALYFAGLGGDGPWARVARLSDVRAGDVIAWRKPAEIESTNTGHIVIALEPPKKIAASDPVSNVGGAAEWLVRVVDSTESPHADDGRKDDTSGLGTGTVGIVVDPSDAPIGYRWKGGRSPRAWSTLVAIARLR